MKETLSNIRELTIDLALNVSRFDKSVFTILDKLYADADAETMAEAVTAAMAEANRAADTISGIMENLIDVAAEIR